MSDYIIYNGELYHHGILGQKWGVRRFQNYDGSLKRGGRRDYKKALNSIDRGIAQERRDVSDNYLRQKALSSKASKLEAKSQKAKDRGRAKESERLHTKSEKYSNLSNEYKKRVSEHLKYVSQGEKLTNRILKQAENSGYTITSKKCKRDVTRGSEWVANSALIAAQFAFSPLPLVFFYTSKMQGTKYNVKRKKD